MKIQITTHLADFTDIDQSTGLDEMGFRQANQIQILFENLRYKYSNYDGLNCMMFDIIFSEGRAFYQHEQLSLKVALHTELDPLIKLDSGDVNFEFRRHKDIFQNFKFARISKTVPNQIDI